MKFRTGLVVGLGIGYVLGARAGRERYEQIKQAADAFLGTDQVQQATERGRAVIDASTLRAREALSDGLHSASDTVREAASDL
jgi:hypothetical protein